MNILLYLFQISPIPGALKPWEEICEYHIILLRPWNRLRNTPG